MFIFYLMQLTCAAYAQFHSRGKTGCRTLFPDTSNSVKMDPSKQHIGPLDGTFEDFARSAKGGFIFNEVLLAYSRVQYHREANIIQRFH